jgi:drug/metabolite transporter (DMT)-like permease
MSKLPPVVAAAVWMSGALVSFVAMMLAARELSVAGLSTFEILAFRSAIALAILSPLLALRGRRRFATRRIGLHLIRNTVHFSAQAGWVYGIALLPLSTVTALEFTTPLWVALLAVLFLGERMSRHKAAATLFGFAGVLIILRPGAAVIDWASLVVLASAFLYACSNGMVKPLTRTDGALVIVFYMQIIQLPLGLVPALLAWVTPRLADVPWLAVMGVTALSAHYCVARALARADATIVFPFEFLRLPLVALAAYALYGERVDPWVPVGAAVMFAANYYSVWREARMSRRRAIAS